MKDQKFVNRLFVALSALLCILPLVWLLVRGPVAATANERLAASPMLQNEDGTWNADYWRLWRSKSSQT